MTDLPGDGFYYQREAKSAAEAASRRPQTREINVTKAVLHRYLQRWLTPDSGHRTLLERYAPRALQFVLDRPRSRNVHFETGVTWSSEDPTERKTQIARFMEQIRERYPAILLIDGGFRNRPAGLGDISGGRMVAGAVYDLDLVSSMVINLDIMVMALDESTCSDLAAFLSSVLGSPLRRFGHGNHLTSQDGNANYQITLPLEISVGALNRENITEDPKDSKWSCTISLGEVSFDAVTSMRGQVPIRIGDDSIGDKGGSVGSLSVGSPVDGGSSVTSEGPTISGPSTARVNQPSAYRLLGPGGEYVVRDPNWKVIVTDRRLATLSQDRLVLHPRRPGTIELRLVDRRHYETDDDGHRHRAVIASLEVAIIR